MDIKEQLAVSFGISAEDLTEVLKAGMVRVQQQKIENLITACRAKSAEIQAGIDKELEPTRTTMAECQSSLARGLELAAQKRDSHAVIVAELESLLVTLNTGESVFIPPLEEALERIE